MSKSETLLALRKQMLISRAALERVEMVRAVSAATQSVQSLRHHIPGLALGAVGKNLPMLLSLIQRLRLLVPVLPVLLMVVRRPLLRYSALGAVATLLLAFKSRDSIARHLVKSAADKRNSDTTAGY